MSDTLRREDFATFFSAMHDGAAPFAWQERLLTELLSSGRWPGSLAAPTGAGKTSVIDIHVFALALTAHDPERRLPRRLAMVVDRRVLVDDQYRYACRLSEELQNAEQGILRRIADRLRTLREPERTEGSPLVTGRLRGGSPPSRSWRDSPTAAAVVCGTPDMWGSRLLFRGYGSSRQAWPRDAGLLAFDAVVVVDEAHLTPQLLCTAREVARLALTAERPVPVPEVQVVETTATPDGPTSSAGVLDADLADESPLRQRLLTPKPISRVTAKNWATPGAKAPVTTLADAVVSARATAEWVDRVAAPTVGCFVNSVGRAVAVAQELREQRNLRVVLICGQVRPIDVELLTQVSHPGVLSTGGNSDVDVLVSTQSLEVGVDLDLAAVVTELAPASALAQRAGRVNRRGLRAAGPIMVVEPEDISDRTRSGPYVADDLRAAQVWLDGFNVAGMTPWAVAGSTIPTTVGRRPFLQRPGWGQAEHWARTSDALHADPELDLWLAEDLEQDRTAGLVVRKDLPEDPADAVELLRCLRPQPHEVFPVPLSTLRDALARPDRPAGYVVRDDVEVLRFSDRGPDAESGAWRPVGLRPGDIVVIDAGWELFTDPEHGPPVLISSEDVSARRSSALDALELEADLPSWERHAEGRVVRRWDLGGAPSRNPDLAALLKDVTDLEARTVLLDHLKTRSDLGPMDRAVLDLVRVVPLRRRAQSDVIVLRDGEGGPRHLVVVDRRRAAADEDRRQVRTTSDELVLLEAHQSAVGHRARQLALDVGLGEDFATLLELAGLHHDDGKADPRFQVRLSRGPGHDADLAKSPPGTTDADSRAAVAASGLPRRWRHEQRSVVDSWDALATSADRELVARIVGTSHGHGRPGFPLAARDLVAGSTTAVDLFDHGGWDELIERTHRRYGLWGCAYLEALFRAADGQISREGS